MTTSSPFSEQEIAILDADAEVHPDDEVLRGRAANYIAERERDGVNWGAWFNDLQEPLSLEQADLAEEFEELISDDPEVVLEVLPRWTTIIQAVLIREGKLRVVLLS